MTDNQTLYNQELFMYPLTNLTFSDLYTYEVIILIIYGIMIIFSFCTNFIAIIVFSFGRRSRSDLSPFLLNLSVFNIIMTVYCMPFTITSVIFQRWLYARELCSVLDSFKIFSVAGLLLTLITIAIDRYCAVRYPLMIKIYSGFKRNLIALVIIWILSIGLAALRSQARSYPKLEKRLWVQSRKAFKDYIDVLLNVTQSSDSYFLSNPIQYKIVDTIQCVPNKEISSSLEVHRTIFNLLQTYFIPLSILAFVYLRIAAMLWHRSNDGTNDQNGTADNNLNSHESVQFKRKLKQGLKMLVAVVILYAVLWLPMNVFQLCYNLLCDLGTPNQNFCSRQTLLQLLYIASHFLTVSNAAINPIIYGFANNRFRSDIQHIKHRFLHCKGRAFSRTSSYQLGDRLRDSKTNQNLLTKDRKSTNPRLDLSSEEKLLRTPNTNMSLPKEHHDGIRKST